MIEEIKIDKVLRYRKYRDTKRYQWWKLKNKSVRVKIENKNHWHHVRDDDEKLFENLWIVKNYC